MSADGDCSAEKVMGGRALTEDLISGDGVLDIDVRKQDVESKIAPVDDMRTPLDDRAVTGSFLSEGGAPWSGHDKGVGGDGAMASTSSTTIEGTSQCAQVDGPCTRSYEPNSIPPTLSEGESLLGGQNRERGAGDDAAASTTGGECVSDSLETEGGSLKNSLFFRGSVMEAIARSKQLNKVFIVYLAQSEDGIHPLRNIEGSDDSPFPFDSPRAISVLSRSCCVLRLLQNSSDAKQFSAIYPVRVFPTVAMIGLQGTLLSWIEGDNVLCDNLATKLEEAEATFSSQVKRLAASAAAVATALFAASGGLAGFSPLPQPGAQHRQDEEQHASPFSANENVPASPSCTPTNVAASAREATHVMPSSSESSLPQLPPSEAGDRSLTELRDSHVNDLALVDTSVAVVAGEATNLTTRQIQAPLAAEAIGTTSRQTEASLELQDPTVGGGRGRGKEGGEAGSNCSSPPIPALTEVNTLLSHSEFTDGGNYVSIGSPPLPSPSSMHDSKDVAASILQRTCGEEGSIVRKSPAEPLVSMPAAGLSEDQDHGAPASLGLSASSPLHGVASGMCREPPGSLNANSESMPASSSSSLTDTWKRVQIQFRLTDGSSLKGEFGADDKLRKALDFVTEEGAEKRQSFAMMIPFPRRVFGAKDMEKTFRELQLVPRGTIILTPIAGQTSSSQHTLSSAGAGARSCGGDVGPSPAARGQADDGTGPSGFLGSTVWGVGRSLGRLLSYLNPLAYLGGGGYNGGVQGGDAERAGQERGWEYQPNPVLQRVIRNAGRQGVAEGGASCSGVAAGLLPGAATTSSSRNEGSDRGDAMGGRTNLVTGEGARRAGTIQNRGGEWGGNVHVLRRSDDDFNGGNAFWNGNSTQFGGNGDSRGGNGGR